MDTLDVQNNNLNKNSSIDRVLICVEHDLLITKTEFCKQIDISTQNLNHWISRGRIPSDKLPKISKIINRSIDWILTGKEFNTKNISINDLEVHVLKTITDELLKLDKKSLERVLTWCQNRFGSDS